MQNPPTKVHDASDTGDTDSVLKTRQVQDEYEVVNLGAEGIVWDRIIVRMGDWDTSQEPQSEEKPKALIPLYLQ